MNIVKSDNLSHGQMPTVFEDRTLFPPPPVIDAQFSRRRSGGSILPIVIFLFMLLPLAFLGWLALESREQISQLTVQRDALVKDQVAAETAGLNNRIQTITAERDALRVQLATMSQNKDQYDQSIAPLVEESAALVKEINDLLDGPRRGREPLPVSLRTIPETWDDAAIAILQQHVDALKAHRLKVIGTTPVQPAPRPVIRGDD
ncbi:MAG: hypothetical protein Q8L84_13155 [Hyphomonas sp.]|nr:hypothetical protein [Hyphomonas sp.]